MRFLMQQAGDLIELIKAGEADYNLAAVARTEFDADCGCQRIGECFFQYQQIA
jgi:hypothetical protein